MYVHVHVHVGIVQVHVQSCMSTYTVHVIIHLKPEGKLRSNFHPHQSPLGLQITVDHPPLTPQGLLRSRVQEGE